MAQVDIPEINLQELEQWFANVVDTLNFDIDKLATATSLTESLQTLDPAPAQSLRLSLNELVQNINDGFSEIESKIKALSDRLQANGK